MSAVAPTTDTITTDQLRALMSDESLRILDVRTGGEFESVHIPGSYNIPLDTLGEHVSDVANVDHPVVLVCQSGGRASKAHQKLAEAGKQTIHILEGGIAAWQVAGGDVIRSASTKWAMDRQVRLVAGTVALSSILVSLFVPGAKWVAAVVGGGLAFSAISNTCAMATVLSKLPYNRTKGCDIRGVLDDIDRGAGAGA